ncbi:lantibiotic dehydratase [Micromonospora sp. NBC_01813]|uniref:lantibiotic dehydratase n=1 Tax=Micromonospora sp. NBC_01813 TaxID=2975988 RepID=UPI002DD96466|nr:lantibiotic dehydratase [Micromonospora sp. NBC_01813]WSA11854.1 lantibiotic dehydratase family protein [Micromonospora sp. NBC_01813]
MSEVAVVPAPTADWRPAIAPTLAPYALVRLAALPYPAAPADTARFRAALRQLVELRARLTELAPRLADALYASADGHQPDFHRKAVLPLRRDVHNGRMPRPERIAELGSLLDRVPDLTAWLAVMREAAQVRADLGALATGALGAERAALAAICAAEPLRRAVTLTGADLLRGIDRAAAAGANPDSRARKSEPNALRYALRVTSKTSPLSWFTYVAWGNWADPAAAPASAQAPAGGQPVAVAQANRTLLTRLFAAVVADGQLRDTVPHRLAAAITIAGEQLTFRRDRPVQGVDRVISVLEEEVSLACTGPLRLLLDRARAAGPPGVAPRDLVAELTRRLPGEPSRTAAAATRYVGQVLDAGLLLAVEPVDPQDPAAVRHLAHWLDRHDRTELADLLTAIDEQTSRFGDVPAGERAAALARLRGTWRSAYELVGLPWTDGPVLAEDVALREPLRLGRAHGRAAADRLPRLAAVAELFDQYLPLRRLVRDRFVDRYGVGGRCARAADFSTEMSQVWQAYNLISPAGVIDGDPQFADLVTPQLRELAEARSRVLARIRQLAPPGVDEFELPEEIVRDAAAALPRWAAARPASYAFFVQPARHDRADLLVLNHVYAGWGRFTSRFLDLVAPSAKEQVAAQIRDTLGGGASVAQFRPVTGFNANLHPLVVQHEVGEDGRWADLLADQVGLRHDPVTDQVRLCREDTGADLDVLYLGFLVPFVMPDRTVPLHFDLSSGLVGPGLLAPTSAVAGVRRRTRLRYHDLVLSRRSWTLPTEAAQRLRAELDADGDVPFDAVSVWRARLGLPAEVFVSAAGMEVRGGPDDFQRYLSLPKPQYVDLDNALHLRNLPRLLGRHEGPIRIEEALPVPGAGNPDGRVVELVAETYRKGWGGHD